MIKKDTFAVLVEVKSYWDRFEVNQERVDKWHKVLSEYDFDVVMDNLVDHVKSSRFAPTIADLVKSKEVRDRYIPSPEHTTAYLNARDKRAERIKNDPAIEEAKAKAKEEITRILGIDRGAN